MHKKQIQHILMVFIIVQLSSTTEDYSKVCKSKLEFRDAYRQYFDLEGKFDISSHFNSNKNSLGKGGFGEVKKMRFNDKDIAVKKITVKNGTARYLLSREIEFLTKISQEQNKPDSYLPGIPEYINCMQTSTTNPPKTWFLYIFQELLYKDLSDKGAALFRSQVKSPWDRMERYQDFARGIRSLHILGIIHSDIKPENLMATNNFKSFKLIDFGMSGYRNTPLEGGTKTFYPPEKLNRTERVQKYGHDIWAFGLTVAMIESSFSIVMNGCINTDFNGGLKTRCKNYIMNNIKNVMNSKFGEDQRNEDNLCLNFTCLINKCLESDRYDRPTADEIVQTITQFFKQRALKQQNELKDKTLRQNNQKDILNKGIGQIIVKKMVAESNVESDLDHNTMLEIADEIRNQLPEDENRYKEALRNIRNKQFFDARDQELKDIDQKVAQGNYNIDLQDPAQIIADLRAENGYKPYKRPENENLDMNPGINQFLAMSPQIDEIPINRNVYKGAAQNGQNNQYVIDTKNPYIYKNRLII